MTISRYSLSAETDRQTIIISSKHNCMAQLFVAHSFQELTRRRLQTSILENYVPLKLRVRENKRLVLTRGHHDLVFVGPDPEEHEFVARIQVPHCCLCLGCQRVQQPCILHCRSIVHCRPNGNTCQQNLPLQPPSTIPN